MSEKQTKLVIVSGATRGLGLAIASRLAEEGYRVVGAARTCTAQFKALQDTYPTAVFERLDLGDRASLHAFVSGLVSRHGVPYALINNAAVAHDGVLGTMHETQIEEMVTVNILGTIVLTKYICRAMLRSREGRIVNISSIIASTGFNGLSVYAATKAAMNGFTRSLARELGKAGITVNAVAPGYMETDMSAGLGDEQLDQIRRRSALRRLTTVGECAGSVSFLLSPDGGAVTGTMLTVDAGNTA